MVVRTRRPAPRARREATCRCCAAAARRARRGARRADTGRHLLLGDDERTSNTSLGIRSVEWLRDNGAAGLVAQVESVYYTLTAPSKGGPTLRALPKVGVGGSASPRDQPEADRPRVESLIHPALPGEGVWRATRPGLKAAPPVLLTTVRDQPEYPRVVAGLAWIDTKRATLTLNPGRLEPAVTLPRGPMDVPSAERPRLLATFNSGFKLSDSHGGFAVNGHTYATMRNGQGTIVGYENGRVDVLDWRYGARVPPGVSFARQNLPLIVNEGRPSPNISNTADGARRSAMRSSSGARRSGSTVREPDLRRRRRSDCRSLAKALIRAGAIRAMELDINSYWITFISYGAPGALAPRTSSKTWTGRRPATSNPDDRDFFALYSR